MSPRGEDRRGLLEDAVELEDAKSFNDVERRGSLEDGNASWDSANKGQFTVAFASSRGRSGRRLAIISTFLFVSLLLWGGWSTIHPTNAGDRDFRWDLDDFAEEGVLKLPSGYSVRKTPFACHSHNDYWRKVPLFQALYYGCIGVEADVWLQPDGELLVGHEEKVLTPDRTFLSLYVNPLAELLDHRGTNDGLFDDDPIQTLILLVDLKTDGHKTFPFVYEKLSYLRSKGYLTTFNNTHLTYGPVTVVATGETPFNAITRNETVRDIFFDAPLAKIREDSQELVGLKRDQGLSGLDGIKDASVFDLSNSYYASTSFYEVFGWKPWVVGMSKSQRTLLREQVAAVHNQGLKARYWETPEWPWWMRSTVWKHLNDSGADILNADDLKAVTTFLSKGKQ